MILEVIKVRCPQCKLVEMLVDKVTEKTITHKCKKCGNIVVIDKKEIGK